ncbi:MAG: hypothetical protein OEV81_08365 [Betaproteobacteria bacterium]|nr:hypothetical protein [Betaproteobacteria bacterium]MDH5219760.1 hypothetical protein [Betaproteobacteria bacterium]
MALIAASSLLPAAGSLAQPVPGAAAPARSEAPAVRAESAPGYFAGIDLSLGPVRWNGNLSAEYRVQQPAGSVESRDLFLIGNWNAASYVYQPWFAQLTANFGFINSRTGADESPTTGTTSLTGGGSLLLFPASRFPFYGAYSVNDTRASIERIGADYRITQTTLRQSYRTAGGAALFSVSVERSELSNEEIGKDVLDVYGARVSGRKDAHSFDLDGQWSANTGGTSGTSTEFARLGGRHGYAPAANLTVDTLASYSRQGIEQRIGSLQSALDNRYAQVGTFASWRPQEGEPFHDEKHPLLVAAGFRATASSVGTLAAQAEVATVSGNLGVTYDLSPLTRLYANSAVTHTGGNTGPDRLTSQLAASLAHVPPLVRLGGEYLYSWNLTGGASSARDEDRHQRSLTGQGFHQISRALPLEGRAQAVFTLGQGLGLSSTSGVTGAAGTPSAGGETAVLTTTAQATWSSPGGAGGAQSYVGLSATDTRSFGAFENVFQLINLQATRQAPIDALSFWTANLTSQATRQEAGNAVAAGAFATSDGFRFSTYGSVSYEHRRAFGVPRLRFFASYLANQTLSETRAAGNVNAPLEQVTDSLEARLDYQIGKLEARLAARSASVDGARTNLAFLRVTRNF